MAIDPFGNSWGDIDPKRLTNPVGGKGMPAGNGESWGHSAGQADTYSGGGAAETAAKTAGTVATAAASSTPWGAIGGALLQGGMSLLGSVLGKADKPQSNPAAWFGGQTTNAPMFPMMSDERAKEHVESPDRDIRDFLDAIGGGAKYDYRPQYDDGSGKNYGLIAQDIKGTKIGDEMLTKRDGKLAVDYGPRSVETLYAIVADLNKRLKRAER